MTADTLIRELALGVLGHHHAIAPPTTGPPEVPPRHRVGHLERTEHANQPTVQADLSPEDAELLLKLHRAGVIDLPGLDLADDNPRHVDWTWEELRRFMRFQRRRTLAESTAYTYIRYLQYLEDPQTTGRAHGTPAPPAMSLRPPREEDWLDVVEHYLTHGKDGNTLNNYRQALNVLLEFLDIPAWRSLERSFELAPPDREIPPDELVPEFWRRRDLHEDPYLADTFRAILHFNFNTGLRPPSEIADLELDLVDFETDRITYWEEKKDRWRYDVQFWPFVVSAKNGPSLRWYVDHVRPQVDTGASDALFLDQDGQAWTHKQLREALARAGKKVWDGYYPYCARHWFAVEFLVRNDFNIYATARRLGDAVATVEEHYVSHAKARAGVEARFTMPRHRGDPR